MAYVQIPKDLNKVKTKVAFNLTKRQIIGFLIAGALSVPVYLYMRQILGNDVAMFLLIVLAFPPLFITFYEKDGLVAEEYFKAMYLSSVYQPKVRYKKSIYLQKRREEILSAKKRKTKARKDKSKIKGKTKKFKER